MTDRHPKITEQWHHDGFSQHDPVDMDAFTRLQEAKMVLAAPAQRIAALSAVDDAIADESATLRQRADLLRVRQELSRTHEKLLRAGK